MALWEQATPPDVGTRRRPQDSFSQNAGLPCDCTLGGIPKSDKPEAMIYYGYRAASSDEYPMENVNLANLEGVVMIFITSCGDGILKVQYRPHQ